MNNQINDIYIKQNEVINLEKLYAQSYIYSSAKKIKALQIFFSVIILIIISFLKTVYEKNGQAIFFGITWEIISPYLSLLV